MDCTVAVGKDFSQKMTFVIGNSGFVGLLFKEGSEIGIAAEQLPSGNMLTFQYLYAVLFLFVDQIMPLLLTG